MERTRPALPWSGRRDESSRSYSSPAPATDTASTDENPNTAVGIELHPSTLGHNHIMDVQAR